MNRLFLGVACSLLMSTAGAAGFDCGKARTKVEHLICDDSTLSDLDSRLAARYKRALEDSNEGEQAVLREQQITWLRKVRDRCSKVSCLQSAYTHRAAEFNWITVHAKDAALCETFRRKKDARAGLVDFKLEEKAVNRGDVNFVIQNVDIDGDKINDDISLFRTGSASKIAPDNSIFNMRLSSNGRQFKQEAQGFYVIGYRSKYYLLTSDWIGEDGPLQSNAYLLDRRGINMVCSFECRLPSGQCGKRK